MVSVTGRPSNVMQDALTFEIDVGQWVSFGAEKAPFPFSGSVPQKWNEKSRPFPNPSSSKYVSLIGFLNGISESGDSKRFTVEIHSMHFLGAAPHAPLPPKSALTSQAFITFLTLYRSPHLNSQGKTEGGVGFRPYSKQESQGRHIEYFQSQFCFSRRLSYIETK